MLQREWILKTVLQVKETRHKDYVLYDPIYMKYTE